MKKCANHKQHEFWCEHRDKEWRWCAADGCQGSCCRSCFYLPHGPNFWRDLQSITPIDTWGIPYAREAWTEADAMGDVLRRVQLGML